MSLDTDRAEIPLQTSIEREEPAGPSHFIQEAVQKDNEAGKILKNLLRGSGSVSFPPDTHL